MFEQETEIISEEITEDLSPFSDEEIQALFVYSRDWTIETIANQIKLGNIDLNPKFQRRNAWGDERRSRLIESLILGLPVPEIVLAEIPEKRKSFLVIDGKQRLLTIAGFIFPDLFNYWDKPKLTKLKLLANLNGLSYEDILNNPDLLNVSRTLLNADFRCTLVSGYKNTDVLYEIFDRLNSGSVPLSTQELRQAIQRGEFAEYLFQITDSPQAVHVIMGIEGPDRRLRDIEIVLRLLSFSLRSKLYKGNLKVFLDESMSYFNKNWQSEKRTVNKCYEDINSAIEQLTVIFGPKNVGRKYKNGSYEPRLNVALLEVQICCGFYIPSELLTEESASKIKSGFEKLCEEDNDFRNSIETTTKTMTNYNFRYSKYSNMLNTVLGGDCVTPWTFPSKGV